jgi:formamidopyrimidine-DNA glycosylase
VERDEDGRVEVRGEAGDERAQRLDSARGRPDDHGARRLSLVAHLDDIPVPAIVTLLTRRYAPRVPEFPEIEALRTRLDDALRGLVVERAQAGHVATLKTFDPPLAKLEGRVVESVARRGKRILVELDDDLVVLVHLMTAGRLAHLPLGAKQPKTYAFRLAFTAGSELVLTESGARKRAGVWVLTRAAAEAEVAHLGPEADALTAEELAAILHGESRRLHALLRDQRVLAGIGRAWANEILHAARLSPFALSAPLEDEEVARLHAAMRDELARGLEERLRGRADAKVYRVHNRLGEPCPVCETPLARVDYEEHTVYYCPRCQTGGRVLKDRRLSRLLR